MKKGKKTVIAMLLTIMFIFSTSIVAFAGVFDEEYNEANIGIYLGSVCSIDESGNLVMDDTIKEIVEAHTTGGTETVTIVVNGSTAPPIVVTPDGLAKLKAYSRDIYDKVSIKLKVQKMGDSFSVKADTERAGATIKGLRPLAELASGVLTYMVVLGMTLFTAMDICYITMPIFREKAENLRQEGSSRLLVSENKKTGENKLRFVTDEAVHAVTNANIGGGKHPMALYLKSRVVAYILVAIVIYMLLSGNVTLLINIALNIIEGLLGALQDLGR